ncbi:LysR family substrate-binding domain-containing protein [Desulfosporosinus sp. OT]|uniref:LysR family substrate-binding domain-containing protein n=1 Tax=Desulfosporosinus sp. OT TaxID=913865 RepID=UPI00192C2ACF|nr:LysR family substrate-binding domain-containing protein [Desulfosporosinus sp. OT]
MQIKAFNNNSIDIGFVRTPVVDPLISLLSVHQETCIAVVPKLHPLAHRASISIGELSTERFILVERDIWPSWYDDILSKCHDAIFSPIIRQHVKEIQTVVGLSCGRTRYKHHANQQRIYKHGTSRMWTSREKPRA